MSHAQRLVFVNFTLGFFELILPSTRAVYPRIQGADGTEVHAHDERGAAGGAEADGDAGDAEDSDALVARRELNGQESLSKQQTAKHHAGREQDNR